MSKFLFVIFLLFGSYQSSFGQPSRIIDVFRGLKEDSIPSDLQLQGLMAGLNDSSFTIKAKSLDRLMESPWSGKLPDSCLSIITRHIDTTEKPFLRSILNTLGQQQGLSDTYLKLIVPLLKDSGSDVRRAAADVLGQQQGLSDAYLQLIVPLLKDSEREVRRYAAYALGQQQGLSDAYLKLIVPLLKDSDREVRRAAADALGQQQGLSDAILQLIVPLVKDSESGIRSFAAYALGQQQGLSDAILQLIVSLLKDSDSEVRRYAADALGQQQGLSDAILQLIVPLLKDSDRAVRSSTAYVLGQQQGLSDAYLQLIVPLLKDSDSYVRRSAASALGNQPGLSTAILKLIVPLLKDSDPYVRRAATDALGQQQGLSDAYLKLIVPLLKDSDPYVRRAATVALGKQQGLSDAILQMIVPLLKDSNSSVRSYAADALGQQQGLSDAYLKLIAPLLKDSNSSVRRTAAGALGQQQGLSDAILQLIIPLLKDSESHVRSAAASALGKQQGLSDAILQLIVPLLKDSASGIRSAAADALGKQQGLSDAILKLIVPLLKDSDSDVDVRRYAADALGQQQGLSDAILQLIIPLLKDSESNVRRAAWQILIEQSSIRYAYMGFPFIAAHALRKKEDTFIEKDAYQSRIPLYELSGGKDSILYLLKWLCRPLPGKYPHSISYAEGKTTLQLMLGLVDAADSNLLFKEEMGLAMPELIKTVEGQWSANDLPDLEAAYAFIHEANPKNAAYLADIISALQTKSWLSRLAWVIGIHLLFWTVLMIAYPYSPMIQETFFWNRRLRTWFGLGYVSLLISSVPFLRRRLFSPYKESLIAEVYIENWQETEYFPDSMVYARKEKTSLLLTKALDPLKGQCILEGESGLGKSMFLRNLAVHSSLPVAYLPASTCTQGLLSAIQQKISVAASDPAFLMQLIYLGAVDILIDGLNEISAEARSRIKIEVEQQVKGNILLTTQPMEWEPPVSARQYVLRPLEEKQVEHFLMSRYPFLEQKELIPESAFETHCQDYLAQAFDSKQDTETLKANRHILSNPMDLTLVAQLIARGEKPSLLDLQQQQYDLMAQDYTLKNMGHEFPLAKFSSHVYSMRLEDQVEIPGEGFKAEILAMNKWKMVVSRSEEVNGKVIEKWYFRHDKIMEYFLAQEFLAHDALTQKHLDDPRFRGVYFLLAHTLKYGDAMRLRELLIQHAAETKDHSLSDDFVMLLRGKKKPRKEMLKEIREEIKEYLAQGKCKEAISFLRKKTNGKHEDEAVLLNTRNTKLEENIRQGTISLENAILEQNKLNKAILELVAIMD